MVEIRHVYPSIRKSQVCLKFDVFYVLLKKCDNALITCKLSIQENLSISTSLLSKECTFWWVQILRTIFENEGDLRGCSKISYVEPHNFTGLGKRQQMVIKLELFIRIQKKMAPVGSFDIPYKTNVWNAKFLQRHAVHSMQLISWKFTYFRLVLHKVRKVHSLPHVRLPSKLYLNESS